MAAFELFKAFPLFISCFTAETVFLFAFLMRYYNEGGRGRRIVLNICNAVKLKNSRGHVVVEGRGGREGRQNDINNLPRAKERIIKMATNDRK